jgi:tRNA (Thr-GGU) A37 N-methylase
MKRANLLREECSECKQEVITYFIKESGGGGNPERIRTAIIFVYQFYDDGIEGMRSASAIEILFYIDDPVGEDDKEIIP